ncbi:cation chanel protein, possibly calcium-activated BK potassium channel, alpha subunit [Ectocarpus siliculosus]|uniref:Cation chanel protein, possibly calcium-activated BK potassium channel, alpha subunit n=1 Tax=Ectocarpus siliculosus TaxID=2880 RepID=D8LPX0_ECTSI|nr:cation chanel protein, possibly calcium-activated BK potassium channel, alpha subunit [Ectocarpus siliculosus]|eukprot:CBN74862.1 cation chanel protein, possibly calcium-activated BK potassium channel, alpha subunit [Ectocarpus siliculosus]
MEWTQAIFSIGTVLLYVTDSYYWEAPYIAISTKLEVFFAVFFSFNFLFELLLSKNRLAFVMSIPGIVDMVTIVPVFLALQADPVSKSPTGFVRLYRVLMLARVFKPLRLLKAVESISPGKDAVLEQTARTMAYFVSTLFLASGLVQVRVCVTDCRRSGGRLAREDDITTEMATTDNDCVSLIYQVLSDGRTDEWGETTDATKMMFHDALYFIIVTFSTVGYGDMSPPDTQSRLAIVLLVGFFFFMIPRELNKLNHLLDLSSKYTGSYPKKLAGGHTIVGCDIASCGLAGGFLEEFFHEDHGYNIMHLVLLVPHEPTMEWKRLVLKFAANDRVTYLKGDLRSTDDLARVSADTASSCFILTNRHGNLREEEKRGFMRAITVQDFNPSLRIFVEAPTHGMKQRLVKVGINPSRIVCASTVNTRMLANACAWEGASTLINNLLVSASIDEQQDMPAWIKEYASGLGKEIYVVSIGAFAGRGFSELVRELFEQHGVILLGISEDRRVVLHPGAGYVITSADLGFLVADDADVAESIVEQAVGALLPFPEKSVPQPPPSSALKGSVREGAGVKGHGSTAATAMALTADGRTAGVLPRLGRTTKGVGGRSGSGGGGSRGDVTNSRGAETAREDLQISTVGGRGEGGGRSSTGGGSRNGDGASSPSKMAIGNKRSPNNAGGGGYIVLVTPTLAQVSTLVEAFEAPQVPTMGFVVVCPLYDWNQERDQEEIRRLREFPQVRLVIGAASRASLREAGASSARMVVVTAVAGLDVRAIVELNDMTYGNHYEILVDLLRSSRSLPPPLSPSLAVAPLSLAAGDCGRPDTVSATGDRSYQSHSKRNVHYNGGSPSSTSGALDNVLSATAVASMHKNADAQGGEGAGQRLTSWWRRWRHRQLGCDDDRSSRYSEGRGASRRSEGDRNSGIPSVSGGGGGGVSSSAAAARAREGRRGRAHWTLTKGVASGAIVPSSLPETLLCQAFYNPAIIMIVEALLDPKAQDYRKTRRRPGRHSWNERDGAAAPSQALMNFMLGEYDALPFGLLRHGEAGSPCGSVFLLAPNLDSWERMQLDSPPPASLPAAGTNSRFPPGDRLSSTTPDLTPPPIGATTANSPNKRGFPPETPCAVLGDRGFPFLQDDIFGLQEEDPCSIERSPSHRQRRPGGGGGGPAVDWRGSLDNGYHGNNENDMSASSPSSPVTGGTPQQHRNLFPSPFSSTLPPETATLPATSRFDANRTSWVGRAASIGTGGARGGAGGGRGGSQQQRHPKGSHAKLDLLLHEMQRLNGRLDTIVGRLGVLEGENRTDRVDGESAKQTPGR